MANAAGQRDRCVSPQDLVAWGTHRINGDIQLLPDGRTVDYFIAKDVWNFQFLVRMTPVDSGQPYEFEAWNCFVWRIPAGHGEDRQFSRLALTIASMTESPVYHGGINFPEETIQEWQVFQRVSNMLSYDTSLAIRE